MIKARLRQLLPDTVAIARLAATEIMAVYGAGFTVSRKQDDSPVTAADQAAHDVIAQRLAALTPAIPLVSEEAPLPSWEERREWRTYWLIDPLDGTREFIRRNRQFAVNIALIHRGSPVLGVVLAPATGTVWYGGPALGAFRQHRQGQVQAIHCAPAQTPPLRVVLGNARPGPRARALLERLPEHTVMTCGASLKLCLIADGSADLFPRYGRISEWDLAAPQAILEAAGGRICQMQGLAPLRYNQSPDLTTTDIIAFGDPSVDWEQYLGRSDHEPE